MPVAVAFVLRSCLHVPVLRSIACAGADGNHECDRNGDFNICNLNWNYVSAGPPSLE